MNGTISFSCFCFSAFLHNSFVLLFLPSCLCCFFICNILQLLSASGVVFSIGYSNDCHCFSLPCLLTQGTDDVFCKVACLNPTHFARFDSSDMAPLDIHNCSFWLSHPANVHLQQESKLHFVVEILLPATSQTVPLHSTLRIS